MRLSSNFTLAELTRSDTATRLGVENRPRPVHVENLRALTRNILQPLRDHIRIPIFVSSGFRSPEVNAIIGGAVSSQHMKGEAADIETMLISNLELARVILMMALPFDQLILEHWKPGDPSAGWVHVSHSRMRNRGQVLTFTGGKFVQGLPDGP
jgi:zinc D-Ala-D-Ala carboxypeptidase